MSAVHSAQPVNCLMLLGVLLFNQQHAMQGSLNLVRFEATAAKFEFAIAFFQLESFYVACPAALR